MNFTPRVDPVTVWCEGEKKMVVTGIEKTQEEQRKK